MKKTMNTPGPWKVIKVKRDHVVDGFATWVVDKRGHGLVQFLQYGESAKVEANARLIAAAPDLLAALTDIVRWLEVSGLVSTKPGGKGPLAYAGTEYGVITEARRALDKAKGVRV